MGWQKYMALSCVAATLGSGLRAQEAAAPAVDPGDVIRYRAADAKQTRGVVLEAADGELLIKPYGKAKPVRVSWKDLRSLEVARGERTMAPEGALVGFATGAVMTGIVMAVACEDGGCDGSVVALPLLVFGGGGALLGALVGLPVKTDRFETIKGASVQVGLAPVKRGAAGGVRVSF